jgi:hypothetical protein
MPLTVFLLGLSTGIYIVKIATKDKIEVGQKIIID